MIMQLLMSSLSRGRVRPRVGILTFSEKKIQNPASGQKNNYCQKYQNPPTLGQGKVVHIPFSPCCTQEERNK